jgi:hypothetical protein
MLIEKRAEFVAKLNALEATRQAEIDSKVAAYRQSLEDSMPKDEINKVSNVIAALDEVIGYEASTAMPAQTIAVNTASVAHASIDARPGMATVLTPSR